MEVFPGDIQTIIWLCIHRHSILKLNTEYHDRFQVNDYASTWSYGIHDFQTRFTFNYRVDENYTYNVNIYNMNSQQADGKLSPNYWYTSTTFLQELKNELKTKWE